MRWSVHILTGLLMCSTVQAYDGGCCPSPDACISTDCNQFDAALCGPCNTDPCCDLGLGCDSCGLGGLGLGSFGLGDCNLLGGLLGPGGLIKPSDKCFNDFISPMTNPVFFEDPRTLSEARFIFLNHAVPGALGGNDAQLYALQIRAALTENLSLIATKDGFIVSQNPIVGDGWADVAAGLKYNVYKDVQSQTLLSVGAVYELPVGTPRALQGNGSGEVHLFASGGTEIFENWHWVTGSGFRLATDRTDESDVWYWSNHLDYKIADTGLYIFGETNWYHWMRSGDRFPAPIEGVDLFNLGSQGVAGNDIVTGALGVKYKPAANMEIGAAYELPLSDRKDVLGNRFTFDYIIRF